MEFLVEARTQSACVCVFDASALPAQIDLAGGTGAGDAREALSQSGKAWFARTPGNGAWPILVRVSDDGVSAAAAAPAHRGTLAVPSGQLWVCGAEFLARDPAVGGPGTPEGGLARHAMGDCVQVPAGTYALTVYAHEAASAVAASAAAPRDRRQQTARALAFGGYLAGGIGVASAAWTLYALWLGDTDETWQDVLRQNVPAILAFLVVGWAMVYVSRLLQGFEAARALATAQRTDDGWVDAPVAASPEPAPAYVVVLSRLDSAAVG